MHPVGQRLRDTMAAMMARSPVLVRAALLNLAVLPLLLAGLWLDERVVTGAPVWLKPAKFAASVAVYLLSLAWMVLGMRWSPGLRRATTAISWLLTLEVVLISIQAMRGTTSHFNVDSALNGAIFSTMGVAIAIVWFASMYLLWRHIRTPASDRAMAIAFRIGLALNIVGAGVGWRMTQPAPGQVEAIAQGVRPRVVGAHTVGAPDGGPGMPITTWSSTNGDLRVPHFVGMHALQWLPLLVVGLRLRRRARRDDVEVMAVYAASLASSLVFLVVLVQALRGLPFLSRLGT